MTRSRWERLAPLSGVLAVAVIVIAVIVVGGSTPDVKASAAKVMSYYSKHRDNEMNAAFMVAIGAGILLFFVAILRQAVRGGSTTGRLANASFAGGIVAVGGALFVGAVHLALADSAKYGDAAVAHTLNILDNDTFLPLAAGTAVMVLAASASALRTNTLPKWLAVVGVIAGVASFSPIGFPAFLVCLAWVVVTSIILALRGAGDHVVPTIETARARTEPTLSPQA